MKKTAYTDEMIQKVNAAGAYLAELLEKEAPELAEKWLVAEANQDRFFRSLSQDEFYKWNRLSDIATDTVPGPSGATYWGLLRMMHDALQEKREAQ